MLPTAHRKPPFSAHRLRAEMPAADETTSLSGAAMARLTGGIAHDLNNLLQTLSGNLELLGAVVAGNEEAEELVSRLAGSAERGGELTRDIVDFCLGQGSAVGETECRRLLDLLRSLLPCALSRVTFRFEDVAGRVRGDAPDIGLCILDLALMFAEACPAVPMIVSARQRIAAPGTPGIRVGNHLVLSITASKAGAPALLGERLAAQARRSGCAPVIIDGADEHGVELWLSLWSVNMSIAAAAPVVRGSLRREHLASRVQALAASPPSSPRRGVRPCASLPAASISDAGHFGKMLIRL